MSVTQHRVLGKLPISFKERGVWFGDTARALEVTGGTAFKNSEAPLTLKEDEHKTYLDAYMEAYRGINSGSRLMVKGRDEQWKEVFGFNRFDVEVAASTGVWSAAPIDLTCLEGDLDAEVIRRKLQNLGYEEHRKRGKSYYVIRRGYITDSQEDCGWQALAGMNRIFVQDDLLVIAPSDEMLTQTLETWAGRRSSLMDDQAFGRLARILGDPLSAALLTTSAVFRPLGEPDSSSDWELGTESALPSWEALGAGYYMTFDGERWWCFAVYYADPNAAMADAEELVRQMRRCTATLPLRPSERESTGGAKRFGCLTGFVIPESGSKPGRGLMALRS
jgi:hypothetical protein